MEVDLETAYRLVIPIDGTERKINVFMKNKYERDRFIALARDRQDLEARQAEADVAAAAATTLQAKMKRRPQREIYSDTIELARDRQDLNFFDL